MKPLDYAVTADEIGLLRRSAEPETTPASLQLQRWLQIYGVQSSAYFNLQAGVRHFQREGVGFLSYYTQRTPLGRVNIVFANPVCAPERLSDLLRDYFQSVSGPTCFMGVDRLVADHLVAFGYHPNQAGTEFSLELAHFEVAGKSKKQLRHAANLGDRYGLVVREQSWREVDNAQVRALSTAWRSQKAVSCRELRLLTRPPVFGDEWQVRKFYCYRGNQLLGYVFFDPFFQDSRIVGYCANILRAWPGQPSGLLDFILLEAIRRFQAEGITRLSLGFAPLHGIQPIEGERRSVRLVQQGLYHYANGLYAFQALAYHKSRYRGLETPWYLCSRDISTLKLALALTMGTGILGEVGRREKAAKASIQKPGHPYLFPGIPTSNLDL